MKTFLILLFFLLLIIYNPLSGQWLNNIQPDIDENLNSVCYPNENAAFVVGDNGRAMFSSDSGSNWLNLDGITTNSNLHSVFFLDTDLGYIVGDLGSVFKTESGGETWLNNSVVQYYNLESIAFNDYENGIAVGEKEVHIGNQTYYLASILITNNSGESWEDRTFDERGKFNSVAYASDNVAIAVGDNGRIAQTTDGGYTWNKLNSDIEANLNSVVFCPSNLGFIVGNNGIVLTSVDGGLNWINRPIADWFNLFDICYKSSDEVVAVGEKEVHIDGETYYLPAVIVFSNEGEIWVDKSFDVRGRFNSLSICNPYLALAVGDNGLIVINQNLVTSFNDDEPIVIQEFSLFQNYPNPFNPTTTIKYQIPELSFVTLKVYDVLGSEIVTLVNEEKLIGYYEVEFDADRLSSGIYFSRLQVGSFVETKKMMLLK